MKYRVRFETTHKELHRKAWDEIRQICTEYSISLAAERRNRGKTAQINLIAEIRSNQKLERDNIDGSKPIDL